LIFFIIYDEGLSFYLYDSPVSANNLEWIFFDTKNKWKTHEQSQGQQGQESILKHQDLSIGSYWDRIQSSCSLYEMLRVYKIIPFVLPLTSYEKINIFNSQLLIYTNLHQNINV